MTSSKLGLIVCIVLAILIIRGCTQTIEVTPVYNDNGFAVITLREKPLVDHYVKFLHFINLDEYVNLTNLIENNIEALNSSSDDSGYILLKRELLSLKDNIKSLTPRARRKRGLVNIIGKSLKFLTGTMDNDDATEIYDHLENLNINSKQMTSQINKQVKINNELIGSIEKIKNHINIEQSKLNYILRNISKKANEIVTLSNKLKYLFQIHIDIMTLDKQIEKIKENIMMSSLEVLAHDILTNSEIQAYNITVDILPYIRSGVLMNGNTIIFTIFVPIFNGENYITAIVTPVPNLKHEQLSFNNEKIIILKNMVYTFQENLFLRKNLKEHPNNCFKNLFQETNICNVIINSERSIEEIETGIIITRNLEATRVQQNCINQNIMLKGNNLLKFTNCKIRIGDYQFSNDLEEFRESVILPVANVNFTKKINNITLETIHLENINNRETIKYIEFKFKNTGYTMGITTIVIIVVILIVFLVRKRAQKPISNKIELKILPEESKRSSIHAPIFGDQKF